MNRQDAENPNNSLTERYLELLMSSERQIYAYLLTLVPNHNDADDLLQETIMTMWRKFEEYNPGYDFASWGVGIARNKYYEFRRKNLKMNIVFKQELVELLDMEAEPLVRQADTRIEHLKKCVNKLEDTDKVLLNLKYKQGLTVREISGRIGKSIQSIYRSMVRITGLLNRCIRRSLAEEAT